jgi:hypothetical protein
MTRYIKYPTKDGGIMLIEVEDPTEAMLSKGGTIRAGRPGEAVQEAVEEVQTRFEDAMNVVRRNAQTIISKVKGLSDPPDEVEVTFGLKATAHPLRGGRQIPVWADSPLAFDFSPHQIYTVPT